ncbi:MAG: hypothetical protein DDT34_01888 [Firmicutes bacterium]|nr:hypothetical protein [Bacillota bacterium]MBT9152977.1 hypothetical protein [Bacillota bacterium]
MRLWLKFARSAQLAYISHLDTHRAYYRLFRRANLPLAFSQGFNPHPILSLASPMPLGYRSEADYVDLSLAEPLAMSHLIERLQSVTLQTEFSFLGARMVNADRKPLAAEVAWTDYEVQVLAEGALTQAVQAFTGTEEVHFLKKSKSSTKLVNAKPLVRDVRVEDNRLRAVLSSSEPVFFRPDEFLALLGGLSGEEYQADYVVRKELYLRAERLMAPLDEE